MTDQNNEMLLDLLIKQAADGLSEAEKAELAALGGADDNSFELAAAAVQMAYLEPEPMPAHLRTAILQRADDHFGTEPAAEETADMQPTFAYEPKRSVFSWLGWAVAAAACVALVFNIATTRVTPPVDVAKNPTPSPSQSPDPARAHDEMMAAQGMVKAVWSPGPAGPEMAQVTGDVVWDDAKQVGYMKFRGLPANDKSKSTYQLWIFEENQGDKTPIDGGTFDIDANGEVVVPINAKLKTKNPAMFAITVEKPGGVVVSKREKIAALAKVETPSKQSA